MGEFHKKVNLGVLRYANCWEDGEVLMKALSPCDGCRVLSIASGGDNSLLLLAGNPTIVLAADLSRVQLFVTELKREAVQKLDYPDLLELLGYSNSNKRSRLFHALKPGLTISCREYWEKNIRLIEAGIIYCGKFERYFRFFSKYIVPLIHSRRDIEKLLAGKSEQEQARYYDKHWNNLRWKLLFHIFFSRTILGRAGRDPAFLKEVKVPVARFIYAQASDHLRTSECQTNYMLRFALTGRFEPLLPPYLLEENYNIIKTNIASLDLTMQAAEDAGEKHGPFDRMNLSNIFEYMDNATFNAAAYTLSQALAKGGRAAYWNLMVARKMSEVVPHYLHEVEPIPILKRHDRGFFYSRFISEIKI